MARPRLPLEETLRWEIYVELRRWVKAKNTIPNPHVFWRKVLPPAGYKMAWGTFQREWERLQRDNLIVIEATTGAPIIVDMAIVEKRYPKAARQIENLSLW